MNLAIFLLSNNFQVIVFARKAKNCFKVNMYLSIFVQILLKSYFKFVVFNQFIQNKLVIFASEAVLDLGKFWFWGSFGSVAVFGLGQFWIGAVLDLGQFWVWGSFGVGQFYLGQF